ncbi:MAG TPA: PA14 domain-containing protein, partial [Candidatus Goldiibacteriota bacterium]|nr:PA14 domain-containing protein [Candidatus Goldiibacteriota bacterium]
GNGRQAVMSPRYMPGGEAPYDAALALMKHKSLNAESLVYGVNLPADPSLNRDYVYILTPKYESLAGLLKVMYPNGRHTSVKDGRDGDREMFFVFEAQLDDIRNYNSAMRYGLKAKYYRAYNWMRFPEFERIDPFIDFDWGARMPLQQGFSVEWTGVLEAPLSGMYAFKLVCFDYVELYIEDKKVMQSIRPDRYTPIMYETRLKAGPHRVMLRYSHQGYGNLKLSWTPPGGTETVIPPEALRPE